MSNTYEKGSVRVDLVGGTIDLFPINLILPEVHTINIALSLKAEVWIEKTSFDGIEIHSRDYKKTYQFSSELFKKECLEESSFNEMVFVARIVHFFKGRNLRIELQSGSPAGSGLGGSSSMGVTLFKALCSYYNRDFNELEAIKVVQSIEGTILNAGVPGYQDYYPALFGGVLGLESKIEGVKVHQLYSDELKSFLENRISLIYSGKSRRSGINNWEVYKAFFDGNEKVISGLRNIASLSKETMEAIDHHDYEELFLLIRKEAVIRESLFENILTSEIKELADELIQMDLIHGVKACGAGGGGCFIILHQKEKNEDVRSLIEKKGMEVLDFQIEPPVKI